MNQNGNYLLDTNIVIGMLTGDTAIEEKMQNGNNLFLSSPTVGELYYGAQKSDKITENLQRINIFVEEHTFLSCDLETAQWYGIIIAKSENNFTLVARRGWVTQPLRFSHVCK